LSLFGCFLLVPDGSEEFGWYIQLNIDHPNSAKGITVAEYDVTGLKVEVYDPNAALIQTIDWVPQDGSTSSRIPVTKAGKYEVVVIHSGEKNGETVVAEESATFDIQGMIITVIDIVPGCIGMINIEPDGCNGLSAAEAYDCAMAAMKAFWDSTAPLYTGSYEFPPGITIDESGFSEEELGGIIILIFTDYNLPETDVTVNGELVMDVTFPPDLLGTLEEVISGSLTLNGLPCETVDFDLVLTMFMEDAPSFETLEWSGSITVAGQEVDLEQVMSEWLAMVLEAISAEDGTITLRITGADEHIGVGFMGTVVAAGGDFYNPDDWLADIVGEIVTGTGEAAAIPLGADPDSTPPPTPVTFTGGESYDVAGFIDANDDGEYNSGDYGTAAIQTVVVDGDTIAELVYPTDFFEVP
jgi:hypothetical protein